MSFLGSWAPDWLDAALDTAGKGVSSAVDLVNDGANTIGKGLDLIPVIGPLYSALWTGVTSPLEVTNKIVQGVPINQVALQTIQEQVQVARTIAPYAQMVMQLVPGVGPIASGAISAGIALANGQTIDEALIEGVKGALPGGPLARAAFDVGKGALDGEKPAALAMRAGQAIGEAAGVQVPPAAAKALGAGLNVAASVQRGEPIPQALAQEAISQLPANEQMKAAQALASGNSAELSDILLTNAKNEIASKASASPIARMRLNKELGEALQVGMALGTGQRFQRELQNELRRNPSNMNILEKLGAEMAKSAADIKAAQEMAQQKPPVRLLAVGKTKINVKPNIASTARLLAQRGVTGIQKKPEFPWGDLQWQQMQGFAGEPSFKINPETQRGFNIGLGLMQHKITRGQLIAVRNALTADEKVGFDMATAMHIGKVLYRNPQLSDPRAQATYMITKGLSKGPLPPENKEIVLTGLIEDPEARQGALLAIKELQAARK